jgi:hypothetical protein
MLLTHRGHMYKIACITANLAMLAFLAAKLARSM